MQKSIESLLAIILPTAWFGITSQDLFKTLTLALVGWVFIRIVSLLFRKRVDATLISLGRKTKSLFSNTFKTLRRYGKKH